MKTGPDGSRLPETIAELHCQLRLEWLHETGDDAAWRRGWNAAMKRALQCLESAVAVGPEFVGETTDRSIKDRMLELDEGEG